MSRGKVLLTIEVIAWSGDARERKERGCDEDLSGR
jgi:hypothetical protein